MSEQSPEGWDNLKNVRSSRWRFLFPGRIAFGCVSILEGRKGVGKSSIAASIAASVTGGPKLPGQTRRLTGEVFWCSGEEDMGTAVRPRLEAAGADMSHVYFPPQQAGRAWCRSLNLPSGAVQLTAALSGRRDCVVVIDPLSSHVAAGWSLNDEQCARAVMDTLGGVASETGAAMVIMRHLRKSTLGGSLDQGIGSVAIGNGARSILRVDNYDLAGRERIVTHVASSVGPKQPGLLFSLVGEEGESPSVKWGEAVDMTEAEVMDLSTEAVDREESSEAKRLLRELLANGPVKSREVLDEARNAGIGERTLRKAKCALGVKSHRVTVSNSSWWEWCPPVGGWPNEPGENLD